MPDGTYATNAFGQLTTGYIGLKEVIGGDSAGPPALHMPLGDVTSYDGLIREATINKVM